MPPKSSSKARPKSPAGGRLNATPSRSSRGSTSATATKKKSATPASPAGKAGTASRKSSPAVSKASPASRRSAATPKRATAKKTTTSTPRPSAATRKSSARSNTPPVTPQRTPSRPRTSTAVRNHDETDEDDHHRSPNVAERFSQRRTVRILELLEDDHPRVSTSAGRASQRRPRPTTGLQRQPSRPQPLPPATAVAIRPWESMRGSAAAAAVAAPALHRDTALTSIPHAALPALLKSYHVYGMLRQVPADVAAATPGTAAAVKQWPLGASSNLEVLLGINVNDMQTAAAAPPSVVVPDAVRRLYHEAYTLVIAEPGFTNTYGRLKPRIPTQDKQQKEFRFEGLGAPSHAVALVGASRVLLHTLRRQLRAKGWVDAAGARKTLALFLHLFFLGPFGDFWLSRESAAPTLDPVLQTVTSPSKSPLGGPSSSSLSVSISQRTPEPTGREATALARARRDLAAVQSPVVSDDEGTDGESELNDSDDGASADDGGDEDDDPAPRLTANSVGNAGSRGGTLSYDADRLIDEWRGLEATATGNGDDIDATTTAHARRVAQLREAVHAAESCFGPPIHGGASRRWPSMPARSPLRLAVRMTVTMLRVIVHVRHAMAHARAKAEHAAALAQPSALVSPKSPAATAPAGRKKPAGPQRTASSRARTAAAADGVSAPVDAGTAAAVECCWRLIGVTPRSLDSLEAFAEAQLTKVIDEQRHVHATAFQGPSLLTPTPLAIGGNDLLGTGSLWSEEYPPAPPSPVASTMRQLSPPL